MVLFGNFIFSYLIVQGLFAYLRANFYLSADLYSPLVSFRDVRYF